MVRSRSSAGSTSRPSRKSPRKRPAEPFSPALRGSLKRPNPSRPQRRSILIALEDRKSSRLYFESFKAELKAHRVVVIAPHKGSAPSSVINSAIAARDDRRAKSEAGLEDDFDEVWVVFDTEGPQNHKRLAAARHAVDRARQLKFKTAVSNPSFEFWLLLHFEWRVDVVKDGYGACRLLKKHIPGYEKALDCFPQTYPHIRTAIDRARRVFKERHPVGGHHPCDCHPCTEVHNLVESLLGES